MLGIFNLLPLLKGWQYKSHVAERNAVVRGADPLEVLRISELGLVYSMTALTDDAYGTFMFEYQGGELEARSDAIYPELFRSIGSFAQDPFGWVSRYQRPNPYSTAGIYHVMATGGYQGSTFPYTPAVIIKMHLPLDSTQESCYMFGQASVIAIVNKKAFIRSLRRVLKAKADLWIDPALLVYGPAEFKELE